MKFYLITKRSHGPWFPKVQFSHWNHYDYGELLAHCLPYGSCPVSACFYLWCKEHCAGALEVGPNPIFASTKHVTLGQSLPVYGLQSPQLWTKDMGREIYEVAFSFMSLSLWLTKWGKNYGQSVRCHNFVSKPQLTPQKCPALGWEWLASCFPEDPMPESLVTSFGTFEGSVFQTYSVATEFSSKE